MELWKAKPWQFATGCMLSQTFIIITDTHNCRLAILIWPFRILRVYIHNRLTFLHTLPGISSYFESGITLALLAARPSAGHNQCRLQWFVRECQDHPLFSSMEICMPEDLSWPWLEGHVCEGVRGVMSLDHCACVAWDSFREAFNGFLTHPDATGTTCST